MVMMVFVFIVLTEVFIFFMVVMRFIFFVVMFFVRIVGWNRYLYFHRFFLNGDERKTSFKFTLILHHLQMKIL